MVKSIYFLLFIVMPSFSWGGENHIRDPKHLLDQIDKFQATSAFEHTHVCGSKVVYERHNCALRCEPFSCKEVCEGKPYKTRIHLSKCTKDSISYESDKGVWFSVTKNNFDRLNFLRGMLSAPKSGTFEKPGEPIGKDYVTLNKLEPSVFNLADNRQLNAMRLDFTYFKYEEKLNAHLPFPQSIVLGKAEETQGLFLEHSFYGLRNPVSKIIEINIPKASK